MDPFVGLQVGEGCERKETTRLTNEEPLSEGTYFCRTKGGGFSIDTLSRYQSIS